MLHKILLVFDLNKTLLFGVKKSNVLTFDNLRLLDKKKPNDIFNKNSLYFRPGRNEFLDYLFLKVNSK